jgi:EAL domain-containing protein (putative c-di-GMP-specific phosphodiesterase class I)
MGCDVAQGYLFSRPVPFDELVDWLRNSQWSPLQRDTNTPALP